MPGPIKLATIECAVCSALIDVFQEFDPEFTLIWRERADEEHTRQHPPVIGCAQARPEVVRMFPERP